MERLLYKKLSDQEKDLLVAAEEAMKNSYSPYQKIQIGGAVLVEGGGIIKGCNFGNASSSVNICAERATVLTANSMGHRNISKLAIIGSRTNEKFEDPIMPCGICRQFLLELNKITGKDLIIISSNTNKTKIIRTTISELLPYSYK